ncbi:putative 2-aminoethylphosphonate ABC transporter permease subunit [Aestuariirhabdus sp. Z084]|uniref:putative 2-aminoethylphosphonate ABC transporter permease subunit n=1 Tax=Aestuariirhabdus haliotis TaxID=2918751 RepID=UPI00201B3981|nr:putative 2-aminoethylphosphonate ABC transporter permease subunit [Aestuariirhabdus haliotis]MCL6416943.1 putative 2-aminoethylphosphonate ABC transporter permease subunit [Aestuariirhabdus haliotis]MCL6420954.1 putative 2-aminoethylphosphonate ABC transporter permease subunit [Aestuariirhabdus haliotis]
MTALIARGIDQFRFNFEGILQRTLLVLGVLFLMLGLLAPLATMLLKSLQDQQGQFVGVANFVEYFTNPALFSSIINSLIIACWTTVIVVSCAFISAYALTRSGMVAKKGFRIISSLPLFAPSLLPALSMIYLFGNQGVLKDWLPVDSIYGPVGIIIGLSFWIFPHALMILTTALANSDARLYEAAKALKTPAWRVFFTITLPGVRYGLVNTIFVCFTLAITDFGVAKVIGGQYNVLATDIYKQVVGQQNFQMGAVVSIILLCPAILSFWIERRVQKRQTAQVGARAVAIRPEAQPIRDMLLFGFCGLIGAFLLLVIGMAVYASLINFWPYNLDLTLNNYQFDMMDGGGWESYFNSLRMAFWVSLIGTLIVFSLAYLNEKMNVFPWLRKVMQFLAMLPMAIPGMVLGLSYIFFFNAPDNPLNVIYGTLAILVLNTLVHFYTVCHLTAVTSLKQIDKEFESVSASLKVPFYTTFFKVTLPLCLAPVLEISVYLFVNAITTVSAVVFLYSADTTLASVAVINMDEAGDTAAAAAMAVLLMVTALGVKGCHWLISHQILQHTQRWRQA